MIAQIRLEGDRWSGTWRTGRVRCQVGDLVVVPVASPTILRLGTVTAVGKTRKAVNSNYNGRLRSVRRLASREEVEANARIKVLREISKEFLAAAQKASVSLTYSVRRS